MEEMATFFMEMNLLGQRVKVLYPMAKAIFNVEIIQRFM